MRWAPATVSACTVVSRSPRDTHDAHLVALMNQHGVSTIWTHDVDFRRFDGIRVYDPVTGYRGG